MISVNRRLEVGTYALSEVFPGIGNDHRLMEIFGDPQTVVDILAQIRVNLVDRRHYMSVANEDGAISIGLEHLQKAEATVLHLDILHELVHVRQQRKGLDLYDRTKPYVDRPTEIEAYIFTVREARRIGLNDEQILRYLEVEWVTTEELMRLARHLNIAC